MMAADLSSVDSPSRAQQALSFITGKGQVAEDKKTVAWVKDQYKRCKAQRLKKERQWYLNLSFLLGHQYVDWIKTSTSASGFKLYVPPAPRWRVRLQINMIRPIIRKEIAKLTSSKPNWTVVPNTTEDQDVVAARVAEQIFTSIYDEKKIQNKLKKAVFWSSSCGVGFIKSIWDPMAICGYGQYEYQGDIDYLVVDPFHIFVPDLLEEEIENQSYIIHAQTRSVEWVNSRFPGLKVQPDVKAVSSIMEEAFLNLTAAKNSEPDEVLLLEMWIKPGKVARFPKGAYLLIVGDNLAQISRMPIVDPNLPPEMAAMAPQQSEVAYPYHHKKYPFVKIDHIPTGQFYPASVIEDLVPVQRELNRTRSQIVENKNLMGKISYISPKGSIDPTRMTSEPGQVIEFNPGLGEPKAQQPPEIPSYVINHLDQLRMDFDDLSAQHEVSRGNAPGSVVAATAISTLQEQDDSQLSTTIDSIEMGMEKLGFLTLSYVEQYWDTERLVKTVGTDAYFDAQMFQGSAIQGNKDVRVEQGSALSISKSARQAFITDLMNNQHIPALAGLEVLNFPGIEKLYENLETDKRQATRENLKMQQGMLEPMTGPDGMPLMDPNSVDPMTGQPMQPVMGLPVNTFDNHELHIEVHNQFRKTQQFEILPPEAQAAFEDHVTQHQMMVQMAMMQQQGIAPPVDQGGQEVSQQQAQQYPQDPMQQVLPGM